MVNTSKSSAKISPTAHYTGYIWWKYGLSDDRLKSKAGVILYYLLQPLMFYSALKKGPVLKDFLLARHQLIDLRLVDAIAAGTITQIVEIAAGLSPRGMRFAKKYGNKITYIEADLEDMSNRKKALIGEGLNKNHQVVCLDAMATEGPGSLNALSENLNKEQGLAIITEGLVNYFDEKSVRGMWTNFATTLSLFSNGLYLSDIHLARHNKSSVAKAFSRILSTFVRGSVYLHFEKREDVQQALLDGGFKIASIHKPSNWEEQIGACKTKGANLVRVIEANS